LILDSQLSHNIHVDDHVVLLRRLLRLLLLLLLLLLPLVLGL
jgi:hypothetical protein